MEENFGAVLNQEWRRKELRGLISQISEHESLLRLKRRWLMNFPLSVTEEKRVEEMLPPKDKIMLESMLREDDVSYDDIRACIEKGFGVRNNRSEAQCALKNVRVFNKYGSLRDAFFLLDDMNNKGLCSFIEILTGGAVKFKKTNSCMKRIIRGLLQKVITDKKDIPDIKFRQLFELLMDQKSFCGNQIVCSADSEAYRADAIKVLDGLDDLPFRTIRAMHRKLKGVKGYIPSLQPPKNSGMKRDDLTKLVKKYSLKMLSNLGEVAEPSAQLAGALGVAGLTLKLMKKCPAMREFRKFSPEIEVLQNDIAKAIHLLDDIQKVSLIELRKVQELLDPSCRLSPRSIRTAIRNILLEYLFECSDMEEVPDCILQTLEIINRRSQRPSRKKRSTPKIHTAPQEIITEVIQYEIECVLVVSAQAKEAVLGLLSGHEFDEDFARAYMDDFEESDTLCISNDDDEQMGNVSQCDEFHSYNTFDQTESIGETNPAELSSPLSISETNDSSVSPNGMSKASPDCMDITKIDSCKKSRKGRKRPLGCTVEAGQPNTATSHEIAPDQTLPTRSRTPKSNSSPREVECEESTSPKFVCPDFLVEEANIISQQCGSANQYLEVQEACDVTSMIAYRFVGHVLDKLALVEGLKLYQGDRLYLRSYSSIAEDANELSDALMTSQFSEIWKSVLQQ